MDRQPTILDALAMWSQWHGDISPLGSTGEYALDMRLADAFRALLYRPFLRDRLAWLRLEVNRTIKHPRDETYRAEIAEWWLVLFHSQKAPEIDARALQRRLTCASF